ncbi:chloride channel protein 3, 4, putative [Talaromyces stipitatus ATCC 10500]|uniref:Chloride channel protein 3, 4, putative n=1 Tax=Talaromyces stipitatus (strain ATCC 10500 / CBS 375.48 / QM 6759 / NRRL 1006) TaxID=441959 RepID=B8M9X9_TALSN|nr:chloride channel protein 3, 4, putative [Talaromyces stipitatus ATCC 10500]EED18131.1 chloride channel protein 3, 4, putative [Talaromyces stipitatus ATCC 10500]
MNNDDHKSNAIKVQKSNKKNVICVVEKPKNIKIPCDCATVPLLETSKGTQSLIDAMQSSSSHSQLSGLANHSNNYGTLVDDDNCLESLPEDDCVLINGILERGTYNLLPSMNIQLCNCLNSERLMNEKAGVVAGFEIWPLLLVTGLFTGLMGYVIAVTDPLLFDLKGGYCQKCMSWIQWSDAFHISGLRSRTLFNWVSWTLLGAMLATNSVMVTLSRHSKNNGVCSGVAELKLRSKGIRLPNYFDLSTILCKIIGIIFSASSGLCLGKEGPYVHIAAGIGSIVGDLFHLCRSQCELLYKAGAAAGFSVAFGAPISGLIFVIEELSSLGFSPGKLTPTLFCCITATAFLKYLDPYGTKTIVMFHVHNMMMWKTFEIPIYTGIGLSGGVLGAVFVKSARFRLLTVRKISILSRNPMMETAVLAMLTGLLTSANRYTKLSVAETLAKLTTPCQHFHTNQQLHDDCPSLDEIPAHIRSLTIAFVIKGLFTVLTFGLKVPAGIYVPTMVLGALFGKIVGHIFQLFVDTFSSKGFPILAAQCANEMGSHGSSCISPGTYALIGAGSLMCGVTRLPVTLVVVLVEITGRFDYLGPFMLAIVLSNWSAQLVEPDSIYDIVASANGYPLLEEKDETMPSIRPGAFFVS